MLFSTNMITIYTPDNHLLQCVLVLFLVTACFLKLEGSIPCFKISSQPGTLVLGLNISCVLSYLAKCTHVVFSGHSEGVTVPDHFSHDRRLLGSVGTGRQSRGRGKGGQKGLPEGLTM